MGMGSQQINYNYNYHSLAVLPTGKTRYLLNRRLGGPQGRFGWVKKIMPPLGVKPRTVQPVVGHCTN